MQAHMFRLNTRMLERLRQVKAEHGLTTVGIDVAAHIRLGDKQGDHASRQSDGGESAVSKQVTRYLEAVSRLADEARSTTAAPIKGPKVVTVYVASDSAAAVRLVREWAVTQSGLRVVARSTRTQNVSGASVEVAKALDTIDDAYTPAEEVVLDLALMLEARFFVGICMSQLARIVVSIGTAAGTLQRAVAMDPSNIPLRDSTKLGVDEGWVPTKH